MVLCNCYMYFSVFFFFKQKTAYEMRISDWSSDVCSSDLGLCPNDAELVEFLVRQHLLMSAVAQKRDLSDPGVIADFAAIVRDERRLTALYLLDRKSVV